MQKHRELTLGRISDVGRRILRQIYTDPKPLEALYFKTDEPVPFRDIRKHKFTPIEPGTVWGANFECAWFRLKGRLDARHRGRKVIAIVDLGGEACVFDRHGRPQQGLTPLFDDRHGGVIGPKKEIPIRDEARGTETINLTLDAGANHLQGRQRGAEFREAAIYIVNEPLRKLYHEYRFLELLLLELDEGARRGQLLLRALNDVCNILTHYTDKEIQLARQRLATELARPAADSSLEVSAIGHAHLDVAWLWPLRETVRKCARTFSTALRMMEEYPDYRFGASQPHLYQMTKDHYPALFEEIREAVAAGKWEVQGGMWVESDCNIPSGESLVRQILYGKRFFRDEFGVDVRHLWLPDVFGYSGALPQILKKSGIDYFTTHKLNWNQFNEFPHHTMYWEGIDGTKIFSHFMAGNDYNVPSTPGAFMNFERKNRDGDRTRHALCLFGIGDGGGGPGRTHIEWTSLAENTESLPRVTMEHAADFFPKAESSAVDLQTWVGELYFEYHRGTYTTQALVKKMNRRLEILLREVELLYAQLPLESYPADELERVWKIVLLNQFHDIIPGSSITRVYTEAHEQYRDAHESLTALRAHADRVYSERVATEQMQDPHVVLNSLSWERETMVYLTGDSRILWVDSDGKPVDSQRVNGGVFVKLHVPAMGHNVLHVALGQPTRPRTPLPASDRRLENDLIRVDFATNGEIKRIYDKAASRDVVRPGMSANVFRLYEDLPLAYEAWDIDAFYLEKAPRSPQFVSSRLVENGPLISIIEQIWEDEHYRIVQRISLREQDRISEFDTEVDWRESQHMLRVDFPVNVRAGNANFEIQFGHVARPTHRNTSWDMARFESVAHKWVDLSQPNYGVALLNDCKYGHSVHGDVISLNLLRSPRRPDPEADRHVHQFRYALYPHPGDLVAAEVVNRAWEFNVPARIYRANASPGDLPAKSSLLSCDKTNVIIDTIKKAEDEDSVIIRLYESCGMDSTATLHFHRPFLECDEVDLLERPIKPVKRNGQQISLSMKPFDIRTIRIRL